MVVCTPLALRLIDVSFAAVSLAAHLLLGAAGAWGFLLASTAAYLGNTEMAAFLGIQGLYYSLFGVWLALGELRSRTGVVGLLTRPFAFLHVFMGRGCFSLYCGTTFLFLPWDPQRPWVSRAAGGLEIAVGVLAIVFVATGLVVDAPMDAAAAGSGKRAVTGGKGGTAAGKIRWGEPSDGSDAAVSPAGGAASPSSAVAEWKAQQSAGSSASGASSDDMVPSTPTPLLPGTGRLPLSLSERIATAPSAAPLPKAGVLGGRGGGDADAVDVVTHGNPFLAAAAGGAAQT